MDAQLDDLIQTLRRFDSLMPIVTQATETLIHTLRSGGKILTCGNGGSAADASHMAEELVGRYKGERKSLAAVCLSSDGPLLTCIGNDYGFDSVFSRQVEGLGRPGDALVVFSTSGNSENIRRALAAAKERGIKTISLLGKDGGKCRSLADHEMIIPSKVGARIQEIHTFVMHWWLERVEAETW